MVWRTAAARNKAAVPVGVRRRDALLIMADFFSQNQSVASLVVVTLPSSVCFAHRRRVLPCPHGKVTDEREPTSEEGSDQQVGISMQYQ